MGRKLRNGMRSTAGRALAFALSAAVLFSGLHMPVFAGTQYSNYLEGWKVQCVWSNLTADYRWNADAPGTKQPKLITTYRIENSGRDYPAGSIRFQIPGIGNAGRADIVKASGLASDQADSEWNCIWEQDSDTYIFTNKFEVKEGQSVNGGFEMLWTFRARDCENEFFQERSPEFSLEGAGSIQLEPLTYRFTSERDRYRIGMSRERLGVSEYEEADSDYIWYTIKTTVYKDWKARGLYRSDYRVTVELPEGKDIADVQVLCDGRNTELSQNGDGSWGFYPFRDRSGDLGNQLSTYCSTFAIGFQRAALKDNQVTVRGHLDRLYNDEEEWVTEAGENEKVDDELKFTVEDYSFSYSGYIYSHTKTGPYGSQSPYSGRLNGGELYNGRILQFTLRGSASRSYTAARSVFRALMATGSNAADIHGSGTATASDASAAEWADARSMDSLEETEKNAGGSSQIGRDQEYSLVLGDDKLAIFLNDGSIRSLANDEYDIVYVTIPADSRRYAYEVYGAFSQDTHFEEYTLLGYGNTEAKQTLQLPDGVKAVFVRVNGVTGSYSYCVYAGIRLHLDWNSEQDKDEAMRPDLENRLVNFSYLRSLYTDDDGCEANDCAVTTDRYGGTYGAELAKRDMKVYEEQLMRDYSEVWLRNPVTELKAGAELAAFEGSAKAGFTSSVKASGTIKADNDGPLKRFSLYAVLPDGLCVDLDGCSAAVSGSGTVQGGGKLDGFMEYVSVYPITYQGKTAVAADFDFSDSPLEISEAVYAGISFPVTLSYTDYIGQGNQYTVSTFLMVHDDGLDKINGSAITTDQYDIDGDGRILEKMAYANSTRTVYDDAAEWREYVSKHVKSAFSGGYGAEAVTRLCRENETKEEREKSCYSYRLDFGLGSSNAKNIVFYDRIEQGAVVALNGDIDGEYTEKESAWQGSFVSVNTSHAESMGLVPTVYYSVDPRQELDLDAPGWTRDIPEDPSVVKSLAVALDTGRMDGGLMKPRQMTYVVIHMQAPENRELIGRTAVNQYEVQYDAYGLANEFEKNCRLPSSETYVKLLDTVGKLILQKADGDNVIKVNEDGTVRCAFLTGARFQIYDSAGQALFEEPKEVNSMGRIVISNVPYGTYYYEETEAPAGYGKLEGRHAFVIDGVSEVLNIENHRLLGEAVLEKLDAEDASYGPLSGAEYELYKANGEQVFTDEEYVYSESGTNSTFVTGADGRITVTGLPWGSYCFKEIRPPMGYELNSAPVSFVIGRGQYDKDTEKIRVFAEAYDEEAAASILLKKTDAESGRPVKDAVYSLYRERKGEETEDQLISSGNKTNAAGELLIGGLKFGTYYFVETRNPGGYQMPESGGARTKRVTLNARTTGQTLEISHVNQRKEGSVNLRKQDDAGQLVGGAEYALWYKADTAAPDEAYNMIGTYMTDSGKDSEAFGEIQVDGLKWGSYYFVETKALQGYEISDERIEFTVDRASVQNTILLDAVDNRKKGSVKLIKVDKGDPALGLEGARYELHRTDGTKCILGQDYELPDGMTEIITGKDGSVLISGIVQGGYYLVETRAPASYSLSAEYIRFSITKENADIQQELTAEDEKGKAVLTINKEINEVHAPFGNPTFIFEVSGGGRTYIKSITLSEGACSGHVSLVVEQGNVYTITEREVARYALKEIIPVKNAAADGASAKADLTVNTNAEVTFVNQIEQYEKFSHTDCAVNIAKARAKLTGIHVVYNGPETITSDLEGYDREKELYTFPRSELAVTAFYDDGTTAVLSSEDYALNPQTADGASDSYTGTVSYTENGITRRDSFQAALRLPAPAPRYQAVFELDGGMIVPDGGDSAQDILVLQAKSGETIDSPVNEPVKEGFDFRGWYTDAALTEEAVFPVVMTETKTFYAGWVKGAVKVKYAVSIYGIQQDTDEKGNRVGLTFGPATGASYVDTYKSHIPSDGQMCMHGMSWREIIAQSKQDPSVFRECLENGCTHSVELKITGKLAEGAVSYPDMSGDGAGVLTKSIASPYLAWNRFHSAFFENDAMEYKYGTSQGGWPDSLVRNTLNGAVTENMRFVSNKDNGFEERMLDEKTALISCFPAELRQAIQPKAVRSDTYYSNIYSSSAVTYDKLWLLSGKEIYENAGGSNTDIIRPKEGELYDRSSALGISTLSSSMNKAYNERGYSNAWWLRSPYRKRAYFVFCVKISGYWDDSQNPNSRNGLAPGFCLPGPMTDGGKE